MLKRLLSSKSDLFIVLLIIVALVLGYLIYQQKKGDSSVSNNTDKQEKREDQKQQQVNYSLPSDLTDDEKALFPPPSNDASEEEQREFQNKVAKAAKKTNSLDLSKCERPIPFVINLTDGQFFEIINKSDEDREMVIDPKHTYKVSADSEEQFKADFGKGPGIYGYGCGQSGKPVGILFVTPKE